MSVKSHREMRARERGTKAGIQGLKLPRKWKYVNLPHLNTLCCVCVLVIDRVRLSATPWTAARQAPLSMGFSRQEHWSGLPFPSSLKCLESSNEQSAQMDRIQKSLNSPSAGPDFLACTWAHVN